MKPMGGEQSRDSKSDLEVAWLDPDALVQRVGETLMLMSSRRTEVVSIPSAIATYRPDPEPHLRLRAQAEHLIPELMEKGLLTVPSPSAQARLTRRTALASATALAGGMAFSLSLPLAAAASSVARRPGFWAINEVSINAGLVDRSFAIKLYLSGLKTEFPEILAGSFYLNWDATVDGQTGPADWDETPYWTWLVTLTPGSALHTTIADFEDDHIAAPDIPGTVSSGTTTIHVLFTYDQAIPPI